MNDNGNDNEIIFWDGFIDIDSIILFPERRYRRGENAEVDEVYIDRC